MPLGHAGFNIWTVFVICIVFDLGMVSNEWEDCGRHSTASLTPISCWPCHSPKLEVSQDKIAKFSFCPWCLLKSVWAPSPAFLGQCQARWGECPDNRYTPYHAETQHFTGIPIFIVSSGCPKILLTIYPICTSQKLEIHSTSFDLEKYV